MNISAQKALLDALSLHQAYLFRSSTQSVNDLQKQFNSISNTQLLLLSELLGELSESERNALKSMNFASRGQASKRIEEIKTILKDWFSTIDVDLSGNFNKSAVSLAVYESTYISTLAGGVSAAVSGEKIYNKAKKIPFSGGQLVDSLFADIATDLRKRVERTIRDGISQGQTNQQIVQRIKGRKSVDYKDGLLESSRKSIDKQVRTARSHVSNSAYIDTYKALGYDYLKVVATLDGRTCITCANYDGNVFHIDDPSRPRFPIHPHNRTVYIGCDKDGEVFGKRPFVLDDRSVKDIPKTERAGKIGQTDANTSFKDLIAENDSFAKEWFGPSKYKLYKEGGYSLDKFVDPLGRQYTLKELKILDEKAFKKLGL